jgi:putative protein kinase ArgK-like GTPase of G3E family
MKRANNIHELRAELKDQRAHTAHEEFTSRVLMFIAERLEGGDIISLVDRINKLENETTKLRDQLAAARKEAVENTEEVRQIVYDQIPKLSDGKLVFETSDDQGNVVYGHVPCLISRP